MKKITKKYLLFTSFFLGLLLPTQYIQAKHHNTEQGKIAIANRASASISIIDVKSDKVINTLTLPAADNHSEPMYIVYKSNRLYVGDRANNRIVVFDSYSYKHIKSISVGNGIFHMWAAKDAEILLVNHDIDNTFSVIDTNNLTVKNTFSIPTDLIDEGYKPHDIFPSNNGKTTFITLVGGNANNDYLLKMSTYNGNEIKRKKVGGDPHLFLAPKPKFYRWPYRLRNTLYVTAQDDNSVSYVNTRHLYTYKKLTIPNAHGIFAKGQRLYIGNIAEEGVNGLYSIFAKWGYTIGAINLPHSKPHNISVTDNGKKIYVTHSGNNNTVSVIDTMPYFQLPVFKTSVTVGDNPFGLVYIPH